MVPHVPQPGHCSTAAAITSGSLIWSDGAATITTLLLSELPVARGAAAGGGSPNIRQNWRCWNLLARVRTLFPHSRGHANTALMKQKSSSLAALSYCSTLSHPGVVFLLLHQYNFKLGLKLQCMIKAVESLACITSCWRCRGLFFLPKPLNMAVFLLTTVVFTLFYVCWIPVEFLGPCGT